MVLVSSGWEGGVTAAVDRVSRVDEKVRPAPRASAWHAADDEVRKLEIPMTLHLEWLKTGRALRGTPGRRRPARIGIAWCLVAGVVLIQAGCTSGPSCGGGCSSCGSLGFLRRTTARILHRDRAYDDSGVTSAPLEYGAPSTVVGPATTTGPMYSTSPSSSSVPSTVIPQDNPTQLDRVEPLPKARSAPLPGTQSSTGTSGGKASYSLRSSSVRSTARLDTDTSARPASGSSIDSGLSPATAAEDATGGDNPLDHLPPLSLPGEVTSGVEAKSPAPSAESPGGNPGTRPLSASGTVAASTDGAADGIGLGLVAASDGGTDIEPAAPAGANTGIARFASVDLKLSGGSVPSPVGLAWLAEKGYRTILDLRESSEVSSAFLAEAAGRGLRYVALPVNLANLDADRIARFQFELASPDARPLFFFDSDGSRAGALWYIRRVTVDRVDPQLAKREAMDVGLKDPAAWRTALAFVDRLEAERAHPAAEPSKAPSDTGEKPATKTAEPSKPTNTASRSPIPGDSGGSPAGMMGWRPLAAMLVTGLSVPLAYLTRTGVPAMIARARASLPAPAPRRKSLPPESGV